MRPLVLSQIEVGNHWSAHIFGQTLYLDTLVSSLVAFAVVLGVGLYLRHVVTAGVPGRLQALIEMVWETVDDYVARMIGPFAKWAVPLCTVLFFYILVSNWLELIPTGDRLTSATADVNDTAALAVIVIFLVHLTSIRQRGFRGYLKINYLHPAGMPKVFYALLAPINLIAQVSYPISLTLRLFGNMFAAALMLQIIALLPLWLAWFGNGLWKAFEGVFVDVIQAFIFALLTVIYLSMATMEHEAEPDLAVGAATT
ncbi:MAG TPA: F0F1 ATP synthase subunit A [Candidatus Dormibacteraeota bacterium]